LFIFRARRCFCAFKGLYCLDLRLGVKDLFMHKKHSLRALNIKITIFEQDISHYFKRKGILLKMVTYILQSDKISRGLFCLVKDTYTLFQNQKSTSKLVSEKSGVIKENCWTVVLVVVHRVFYSNFIISFKRYDMVATTFLYIIIILCYVNKLNSSMSNYGGR
jgi:hypothetical protein